MTIQKVAAGFFVSFGHFAPEIWLKMIFQVRQDECGNKLVQFNNCLEIS